MDPIAWGTAGKVSRRIAKSEPFSQSYLRDSMQAELSELTTLSAALVAKTTGLHSAYGEARASVVDRPEWAEANIASMRRLLRPALGNISAKTTGSGITTKVGRQVTGGELGFVLGWMSSRVLGQYDPLLYPEITEQQDMLYYVAPNILALEKRFGFPPTEFRMWIALHECTHRAQFTGVPWLVDFFKEQVGTLSTLTDVDPQNLANSIRKAVTKGDEGGAGLGPLTAALNPEQRAAMERMMGLMSLLEGHGEVIMTRAAGNRVPNAERFQRVMTERRKSAQGLTKLVQRLLGMDVKLRQYAQGAAFMRAVEEAGGTALFDRIWDSPETLPSYKEISSPELWISRMKHAAV